ncbi:RNA methyltransferase [Mycolicibacterium aromaticivorans JS19b1 = JCM 16368]|uniref:RNA methyltransferase n=1 Tax=Mycolicibacterium aromaticivorans JS19b1 = JCM 16368 TaxID=1440774 RepID=A0A064CSZ9_9MYCO|nr:RNA methyltransferase [Mycolicibacterium aromaticivorans]KDF01953.1 RNA methyltransferase [Mycolicibacterium aromaticivorans JS19b1 = JCM 16368]
MSESEALTERSARVAAAVKLQRHTGRRRAGRFLAEGPNLVEAAGRRGLVIEVFATEPAMQRHAQLLTGLTVHRVTERAAKALSETVTPSGLVAVCTTPDDDIDAVLADRPPLVVVAVELSEPGNAGTLIRLADAMGAAAVMFAGHSVDPYNGKVLRSSAGSIFAVPVVVADDPEDVFARLRGAGLQVLATTLDGEMNLDDADPVLAAPTAWVFGPESQGLSADVAALADRRVKIPMTGGAESLNVAAAAAICLYQSARVQRAGGNP